MKDLLINALFYFYSVASLLILGWGLLFPFGVGMDDFPLWTGWVTYPLCIVIMATQSRVIQYFINKNVI